MRARNLMMIAAMGSAALMLGALGFQHLGGLAPCKMCIWQRWPHVVAIALGLLAIGMPNRWIAALGAAATAVTGVIGLYHTGVEKNWWEGPTSCTSGSIDGVSADDLMDQILSAPLVRCDEVPWELFTLSMASWNAVVSFALMLIWITAFKRASA